LLPGSTYFGLDECARSAFKVPRCLVPASGFFEWKTENRIKQPYYISLTFSDPMAFAGRWKSWYFSVFSPGSFGYVDSNSGSV